MEKITILTPFGRIVTLRVIGSSVTELNPLIASSAFFASFVFGQVQNTLKIMRYIPSALVKGVGRKTLAAWSSLVISH